MTLRVLALSTLPSLGPGNRLRVEQYIPHLRPLGIELEVVPFFDDAAYEILYRTGHTAEKVVATLRGALRRARDVWRARSYDLLLVYRESAPIGPAWVEALWGRAGRPYAFDFDDAIFLGPVHPTNRRWSFLRSPSRVTTSVRRATAVIAGNEYLADWARALNDDVTVLTTPVDTRRHLPRRAHAHADPLVIGWVGSSTTAPYLHLLDEPLARLARSRDVLVRVVGGRYSHPDVRVEELPYSIEREPADLASFDIGVLPQPQDAWTLGKGAFKALLYMATSLPVVASTGGVNHEVVTPDVGICVGDPNEWTEALMRLSSDPDLRQRMGEAGRRRIEHRYSLDALVPRFAAVLRRAAGVPG